jgi:hypothetical protein
LKNGFLKTVKTSPQGPAIKMCILKALLLNTLLNAHINMFDNFIITIFVPKTNEIHKNIIQNTFLKNNSRGFKR